MVWMTMLGRLTGSSGLPANETRGRRVGGSEWMSKSAQCSWLVATGRVVEVGLHLDSCQLMSRETIKDNWE